MTAGQAVRAQAGVARVCATALDEKALLNGVSARLRPLLDWHAAAWMTTDPEEDELLIDDINKFVDLAAHAQAAILSDLPDHTSSARWSDVMRPVGMDAELRATFVDATGCWGVVEAHRVVGRPDFTPAEANLVVSVSDSIAAGLRRIAVERSALAALARGGTDRPRRTRMRAADGRWVTLHASPLVDDDGAAIIVEPAPAHEIASLQTPLLFAPGDGDHWNFLNAVTTVKVGRRQSDGMLTVIETVAPRGFGPPCTATTWRTSCST